MALACPLLLVLLAAPALQGEAGLRLDTRARSAYPGEQADVHADLQLSPRLLAVMTTPTTWLSAAWRPRLLLRGQGTDLLHAAEASARWDATGRLRLRADQALEWGAADFLALSPGADALQAQPAVRSLRHLASRTSLAAEAQASRLLRLSALVGWERSGGEGAEALAFLPRQLGPRASARLRLAATGRDVAEAGVSGSEARFSNGRRVRILEASGGWERRFADRTRLRLSAGGSVVGSGPEGHLSTQGLPVAEAWLGRRLPGRDRPAEASLFLRLGPQVDRLTGEAEERAQAALTFSRPLSAEVWLVSGAGASATVHGPPVRLGLLHGEVGWRAAAGLDLVLGASLSWQRQPALTPPSFTLFTVFAAVSVSTGPAGTRGGPRWGG